MDKIIKVSLNVLPPAPERRLTDDEYNFIYGNKDMGRVPRVCVDALIVQKRKILLVKRNIEPFKGYWALAGGGILFGESADKALKRILRSELGVGAVSKKLIGNIEHYPDGPNKHSVSMAYLVEINSAPKPKEQADEIRFFSEIPENTQPYQAEFLKNNWRKIMA